jgi:hypothetical protein
MCNAPGGRVNGYTCLNEARDAPWVESSSRHVGIRIRDGLAAAVAIMVGTVAGSVPASFIFGALAAIVVLALERVVGGVGKPRR